MKNKIFFSIKLYIINILIYLFNCECSDFTIGDENNCTDLGECLYYNGNCISCQGISSEKYFQITSDGDTTSCSTFDRKDSQNINIKLIYDTKELVEDCPSEYANLVEDICYSDGQLSELGTNVDKKCPKYYYIKEIDGFSYFKCTNKCPSGKKYFDRDTKKCLDSCEEYLKKIEDSDTIMYRCSSNCSELEFIYEEDPTSSTAKKYCLDNCPNEASFYFEPDKQCLTNCNDKYFNGTKCISICDSKIIFRFN